MKNLLLSLIAIVSYPFIALAKVIWSIAKSIFYILFKLPAEAIASLVERLNKHSKDINKKLDEKTRKDSEKKHAKRITHYLEKLLNTDNVIGNASAAKRIKTFAIVLLQMVSFVTTYYGLYQLFSAINPLIPFLLAVVIQIMLTFLCTKISGASAPKAYRWLLVIFLTISISFSYVGVCYTILTYQNYARDCYIEVSAIMNSNIKDLREKMYDGESPLAQIESAYNEISEVLTSADEQYGEDALEEAEEELREYRSRTIVEKEENPVYITYDSYGNVITYGGGNTVIDVSDPDSVPLIEKKEEDITKIKKINSYINTISESLSKTCNKDTLIETVKEQMENPNEFSETFVQMSGDFKSLCNTTRKLAVKTEHSFTVSFDLEELMNRYRDGEVMKAISIMPDFKTVYRDWSKDPDAEITTDFWGNFKQSITSLKDYSTLKQILDEQVSDTYRELIEISEKINYPSDSIREAYENYRLMIPLTYDYSLLNPMNPRFGTALLALIVAIANDGLAVLIGAFLESRKVNWAEKKKSAKKNMTMYIYTQFKAIISPMMIDVPVNSDTPEVYYRWFINFTNEFLNRFDISYKLNDTAYSRYYIGELYDDKIKTVFSFLSDFGLVRYVSPDEMLTLGLIKTVKDVGRNELCALLSKEGELWLSEIIGGASDEVVKLFSEFEPSKMIM